MRWVAMVAAALALAIAGCGGGGEDKHDSGGGDTTAGSAPVHQPQGGSEQQASGCKQVPQPAGKGVGDLKKPTEKLDPDKTYELTFNTNCGKFVVQLDQKTAPNTSASLVYLAKQKFYDGLTFHRIVPDFVIQGGDPTGKGDGGPGYSTVDKPPADAKYTKGVVAMAKTQDEAPGTSGSQFYVVTAADAALPPDYAVVGKVVSGQDVVDLIGTKGDPNSGEQGTPIQPFVMDTVTVSEK
jgi:cyclophilin family peptidyl-prolyl cis-trans isomerase